MDRAVYRIIDANFNRAREGLRMAEEFCRFALDNQQLCSRCKEIRHKLSTAAAKFGMQQLAAARDTENDVGCGLTTNHQLHRQNLEDCAAAGLARTVEAIRVISEAISIDDAKLAGEIEKMRYECYSLEKDIALFGFTAVRFKNTRLYCILTVQEGLDVLKLAEQCAAGGADCLQLRVKNMPDDRFCSIAKEFVKICQQNDVISIVNDRADIAIASGADGVHLGQNDLPADAVRKMQMKPLIIGVSTHSIDELSKAVQQRPTYVGIGCVFPTQTKQDAEICGLEYVRQANEFLKDKAIETVALGGITLENIDKVLKAGARRVAVSSCVCSAKNPQEMCRKLKQLLVAASTV